jgi:hypothetical protein
MQTLFVIYDATLDSEISGTIERAMMASRRTRVDGVIGARMLGLRKEAGCAAAAGRLWTQVAETCGDCGHSHWTSRPTGGI